MRGLLGKTALAMVLAFAGLVIVGALGEKPQDPATDTARESSQSPSPSSSPGSSPRPSASPSPARGSTPAAPEPSESPSPRPPKTFLVASVTDGDTLDLANGETVRLVGMDSPEQGECGYDRAADHLAELVLGQRVLLTKARDENRDRYGRLLRYVDVGTLEGGTVDAGLSQIKKGLAIARYDSRDGYGSHDREDAYIAADKAAKNVSCDKPQPLIQQPNKGCSTGYTPCLPPAPPDLDCADVGGPVYVTGSDPHDLDADGDGVACES